MNRYGGEVGYDEDPFGPPPAPGNPGGAPARAGDVEVVDTAAPRRPRLVPSEPPDPIDAINEIDLDRRDDDPAREFDLLRPIIDRDLGPLIQALDASGHDESEIVGALARDHHVRVPIRAVRRWLLHVQIVARQRDAKSIVDPELSRAIEQRQNELEEEAPRDLARLDRAIDFLDRVAVSGHDIARETDDDGRPNPIFGVRHSVRLREQVKAAKEVPKALAEKYGAILRRPVVQEDGDTTKTLQAILEEVYGPTAEIRPEAARDDPLGLLGPRPEPAGPEQDA